MSFKREGDDKNLIGNLRQRRLKDLLGEDIPKDEALLLSNGRYTCLVCSHRPIFDTVNVLYLHRQGKKHAENLEYFQQQKIELNELIFKRKHDQFLLDGTTSIQQASVSHKGLGCGPAYDPRVKKKKVTHRKLAVDLQTESAHGNDPAESNSSPYPDNTVAYRLSNKAASDSKGNVGIKNNKMFRDMILEQQQDGPVKHCLQLKNIFRKEEEDRMSVAVPYRSKRSLCKAPEDTYSENESHPSGLRLHDSYISNKHHHSPTHSVERITVPYAELAKCPPGPPVAQSKAVEPSKVRESVPAEVKEKAKKYLHYRGAGWKKDLYGNWIKDEDAEFDSDEEPPDLP